MSSESEPKKSAEQSLESRILSAYVVLAVVGGISLVFGIGAIKDVCASVRSKLSRLPPFKYIGGEGDKEEN